MKTLFFLLFFVLFSLRMFACMEMDYTSEGHRMALFKAQLKSMFPFEPFYYSASLLNANLPNPEQDWHRNCKEWQKKLGAKVLESDIYAIIYGIDNSIFLNVNEDNRLKTFFEGNTFVESLLLPKNADLLNYLIAAKKIEFEQMQISDPWGLDYADKSTESKEKPLIKYINDFKKGFANTSDEFLKQRYGFQLVKLFYQTQQMDNCIAMYEQVFKQPSNLSILNPWALLYKALALESKGKYTQANYYFALVFTWSDEKKVRCYQRFNEQVLDETMALAQNQSEKTAIMVMAAFKNPAPALNQIQFIIDNEPQNQAIASLIMREINKIEDWFSEYVGSFASIPRNKTDFIPFNAVDMRSLLAQKDSIRNKNRETDLKVLSELTAILKTYYVTLKDEPLKSYIALCLSHCCYLNTDWETGKMYAAKIANNAEKSILEQKNFDDLFVEVYSGNLNDIQSLNKISTQLFDIEKLAETDPSYYKLLYSLLVHWANRFEKAHQWAYYGLLMQKSERYMNKTPNAWGEYEFGSNYTKYLAIFDRVATPQEMNIVIDLCTYRQKSMFEQYLSHQPLADVNYYKDLKGTLLFRQDQLEAAYQTFAEIPDEFWEKYKYTHYLNENPFIVQAWGQKRDLSYHFIKKEFVKQLIDLRQEAQNNPSKKAENYLKMANAYFNCTNRGNSWMMYEYANSWWEYNLTFDHNNPNRTELFVDGKKAREYYQKAFEASKNRELKATCLFMLHRCDLMKFEFWIENVYEYHERTKLKYKSDYLVSLYKEYAQTQAFKHLQCPLLDAYVTSSGFKLN